MWEKLVQELRRVGPRKIAILTIAAVVVVLLAYGNEWGNDASGKMLPRTAVAAAGAHATPRR
jgi:hypothetical protein